MCLKLLAGTKAKWHKNDPYSGHWAFLSSKTVLGGLFLACIISQTRSRICLEEDKLDSAKNSLECSLTVQQCGCSSPGAQEQILSMIQVHWHRQKQTLLTPRWVSLGQEYYNLGFFPLFSFHKEKMASPSHTHHDSLQPNVLSWMSPVDLKPADMRKLLFC